MITIVNYGLGNLGSIANMLKSIGEKSVITADISAIKDAEKIILPGVGAFDTGMSNLSASGLIPVLKDKAANGTPILGICLGMQLLGRGSEEGYLEGLNLIPFECKKFSFSDSSLKVPHMGWNYVEFKKDIPLIEDLGEEQRYYFVHSYHAVCDDASNIMITCNYGYDFAAAVCQDNVMGVQFHPEKSHDFGKRLLTNFVKKY